MSTPVEVDSLRERELSKMDTAGSVVMTKELFEKLYLSPENHVAGKLRKTFANPTPLGLAGFLLALTPLSCDLMGWRGAGGNGAASTGAFYFFGGVIALLVAIGEFILGNSFGVVMFGVYGGWFLTYGATLTPFFNAIAAYDPTAPLEASTQPAFLASLGYLILFMAVFNFVMLVCSIRTNAIFFLCFVCLECAFCFIAASYFFAAEGVIENFLHYQKVGGGFAFGASMLGWYMFIAEMFEIIDFPIQLPVGDLSTIVKGRSERAATNKKHSMV